MLILSRRKGETIRIGEDVTITVVAVRGNKVRIGVEAPSEIPIDRGEIHERKCSELGESRCSRLAASHPR